MQVNYYYFDVRARGFVNRMLLEFSGINYTDHKISFNEWTTIKNNFPFQQLPVYKDNEIGTLAQVNAISRYLAKKYNLYGSNLIEQAKIDEIYEECNDILELSIITSFGADGFEERKKKFIDIDIPKHLGFITKFLQQNNENGWCVGNSLSLADIQVFHVLNNCIRPFSCALFSEEIKRFLNKFKENEIVSNYLKHKLSPTTTPDLPIFVYLHKSEQFNGEFD